MLIASGQLFIASGKVFIASEKFIASGKEAAVRATPTGFGDPGRGLHRPIIAGSGET
ncbi:hypothetical protein [Actinoplanes sp. NPDC026619]|uniref:hypothetical protein n=1 Tax=Actinoplanes sp. NPDC026619 TaxID=3155798 RepID=UPI003406ED8C